MKKLLPAFWGLLLLGLLAGAAWWLFTTVLAFLTSLQSDLAVAIAAASIAGLASVLSLAISKAYETRSTVITELRAKKTPIYEGIVKTMFQVMFAEKLGRPALSSDDLVVWFTDTTEKLSIWGSDDLILAFDKFKNGFSTENPIQGMFAFENLVLAIRKDLGHSGRKLSRGSILRLFITDVDQHLK